MLYNGYMHPKSIFLLTDVVSTSVYGWLKKKKKLKIEEIEIEEKKIWICKFCVISLLYVIVLIL